MASLKEATTTITDNLESLVGDLRSELENGEIDFERLASLADQISESADGLAETFSSVNETLMQRLDQIKGGGSGGSSRSSNGRSQKKSTAAS
jgi:ABC-type transporter Mla subunit MlaD